MFMYLTYVFTFFAFCPFSLETSFIDTITCVRAQKVCLHIKLNYYNLKQMQSMEKFT